MRGCNKFDTLGATMKGIDRAGSIFLRSVLKRMKELGLNNSSLAQRMKVSRPYVVKVLHGDVNISLGSAARFAKALEMDFFPTLTPRGTSAADDAESQSGTAANVPRDENLG